MYNWQHKQWPQFQYNIEVINDWALAFSLATGEMTGAIKGLSIKEQQEALVRLMLEEALKTFAIEGEALSREDVRSSIENRLGIKSNTKNIKDKRARAVAALMHEVRNNYSKKLSETLIKQWHVLLFADSSNIKAGKWRSSTEAMQIVSGAFGKETVHFEAPPAIAVPAEMKLFVQWYNQYKVKGNIAHAMVKTALAHLYFESIHPFEDGNGRIGRAIAEKCLSESMGRPVLLSLSVVFERQRKQYYVQLKKAQRTLNVNDWLLYFAQVITEAQQEAVKTIQFSLKRTMFLDSFRHLLNERQKKVIVKILEAGTDGFTGGITARKYIALTKVSKATATRDLQYLAEHGIVTPEGDGRNVHYHINWKQQFIQ